MLTEPMWRKVGAKRFEIELPGEKVSVKEAFRALVRQYPALGEDLDADADLLDSNYSLFLNDRMLRFTERDRAEVRDGDEIAILMPMAGGQWCECFAQEGAKGRGSIPIRDNCNWRRYPEGCQHYRENWATRECLYQVFCLRNTPPETAEQQDLCMCSRYRCWREHKSRHLEAAPAPRKQARRLIGAEPQ